MKSSEILREAARLVSDENACGGCWAVVIAADADMGLSLEACLAESPVAHKAMQHFYRISPNDRRGFWWTLDDENDRRIIGLCLAAAIAESEGD